MNKLLLLASASALAFSGASQAQDLAKLPVGEGLKVFPESITSTADGTVWTSSMMTGSIFRGTMGRAAATAWTAPASEGPPSISGVLADEKNGVLWACYVDLAAFAGGEAQPSILRTYRLADASLQGTYPLPPKSFCNDIAVAQDGTAFVTDTSGGRIFRVAAGGTALESWYEDPALAGVDGISFDSKGTMFINNVMTGKLQRIDVDENGKPSAITDIATSAPLKGPDGMRFGADDTLYLAENQAGQVDAITIDGDTAEVRVLQTGFDSPTAVSVSGDTLLVGEAKFSQMQAANPGPFFVYAVPLK